MDRCLIRLLAANINKGCNCKLLNRYSLAYVSQMLHIWEHGSRGKSSILLYFFIFWSLPILRFLRNGCNYLQYVRKIIFVQYWMLWPYNASRKSSNWWRHCRLRHRVAPLAIYIGTPLVHNKNDCHDCFDAL